MDILKFAKFDDTVSFHMSKDGQYLMQIVYDSCPDSPRVFAEPLSIFVSCCRGFVGDKNYNFSSTSSFLEHMVYELNLDEDLDYDAIMAEVRKHYLVWPIYAYKHGSIALSLAPFSCPWDSGKAGYALVDKETIAKMYGELNEKTYDLVKKLVKLELSEYEQYLNGEVYGCRIFDKFGDQVDLSHYGYYSIDAIFDDFKSYDFAEEPIDIRSFFVRKEVV